MVNGRWSVLGLVTFKHCNCSILIIVNTEPLYNFSMFDILSAVSPTINFAHLYLPRPLLMSSAKCCITGDFSQTVLGIAGRHSKLCKLYLRKSGDNKYFRTIYHEQLWSRIRRTAAESCEVLLHLFQSLGKAEVTKKHVILAGEEHILCLDIPEDEVDMEG